MSSDWFTTKDRQALAAVMGAEDTRFTAMVQAAELDPAQDLRGMGLQGIILQPGEDLAGYDFSGADLSGAVFRRVDLRGATFTNAHLAGADVSNATIGKDQFSQQQLASVTRTQLPYALQFGTNRTIAPDLWPHVLRILTEVGEDDAALHNKGFALTDVGQNRLALVLDQISFEWRRAKYGAEHQETWNARTALAVSLHHLGAFSDAARLFEENYALIDKITLTTENILIAAHNLGCSSLDAGRIDIAILMLQDVLPGRVNEHGERHRWTISTRSELARAYLEKGEVKQAQQVLDNLPEDGSRADNGDLAQIQLCRAWLADLAGGSAAAADHLVRAKDHMSNIGPEHDVWRTINRYLETRTPGGAGGTTIGPFQEEEA